MRVCWILIGRFWNCRNFLKNDPNNIKLILVVYHWNVFWMVSKVILYRTHVRVCARALLFRHFSDTKMAITFELKTEINSNFYCRFITQVLNKRMVSRKIIFIKFACAWMRVHCNLWCLNCITTLWDLSIWINSFERYISDMYWDSLLIGDVKIIIAHTLARALKSDWMIFVCTYLSLFNQAFGMKFWS